MPHPFLLSALLLFATGVAGGLFFRTGLHVLVPLAGSGAGPALWALSVALGGLALGAFLLEGRASRTLAATGWLGAGLGLCAALFSPLASLAGGILPSWLVPLVLLPPAFLAGGLPAAYPQRRCALPPLALGAAAGIVWADFGSFQRQEALLVSALVHLLLAAGALLAGRILDERPRSAPPKDGGSGGPVWPAMAMAMGSTLVLLGAWRWFHLSTGGGSLSQALFLAVLAAGLGTGCLVPVRSRLADPGLCLLLGGAAATLSMCLWSPMAYLHVRWLGQLDPEGEAGLLLHGIRFLACAPVVFLPAFFAGALLFRSDRAADAPAAAAAALPGLCWAAWISTPHWGVPAAVAAGASALWVSGAWLMAPRQGRGLAAAALPLGAVLYISIATSVLAGVWQDQIAKIAWMRRPLPRSLGEIHRIWEHARPLLQLEGPGASVAVLSHDPQEARNLSLRVNGRILSTTLQDRLPQSLAGHLPLLLHGEAREVALVGMDCGITAASILKHDSVRRVDLVEPLSEVVRASAFLRPWNEGALEDDRLRILNRDPALFLRDRAQPCDVIVHGAPRLLEGSWWFTREHYLACREALRPGGLLAQRLPLDELDGPALETILATLSSVFPQVGLWQAKLGEGILVASEAPWSGDPLEAFRKPALRQSLEDLGITRPATLLMLERISPSNGGVVPSDLALLHTQSQPLLDQRIQRSFPGRGGSLDIPDERLSARPRLLLGRHLQSSPLQAGDYAEIGSFHQAHRIPSPRLMRSLLSEWSARFPSDAGAAEASSRLALSRSPLEAELSFLEGHRKTMLEQAGSSPALLNRTLIYAMESYRLARSVFHLPPREVLAERIGEAMEAEPSLQRLGRLWLAELAWDGGQRERFLELAQLGLMPGAEGGPVRFDLDPRQPHRILALILETCWREGNLAEAAVWIDRAFEGRYLGGTLRHPPLERVHRKLVAAGRVLEEIRQRQAGP